MLEDRKNANRCVLHTTPALCSPLPRKLATAPPCPRPPALPFGAHAPTSLLTSLPLIRLLTTENMRLKKLVADLQVQLLNKPTARGESAAMKSMRELVGGWAWADGQYGKLQLSGDREAEVVKGGRLLWLDIMGVG